MKEKQAYSTVGWNSKPAYVYYEITCGYDQKFGKPRKLENILPKLVKAIETLKAQTARKAAEIKIQEEIKTSALNKLGKSFIAKEERVYSKIKRGRSWMETEYISDQLTVKCVAEGKFHAYHKASMTADQVNKLNEFLKTL